MFFSPAIMFIIFWEFLIVEQIFLSPQVKHSTIILFVKNWYLQVASGLKNYKILGKSQNFIELLPSAYSSFQNKHFVSTSKKLLKNSNLTIPVEWTIPYFTLKLQFVSNILWIIVYGDIFFLLTRPSNLICLTIFPYLRPLTQFYPKISANNLQKKF